MDNPRPEPPNSRVAQGMSAGRPNVYTGYSRPINSITTMITTTNPNTPLGP